MLALEHANTRATLFQKCKPKLSSWSHYRLSVTKHSGSISSRLKRHMDQRNELLFVMPLLLLTYETLRRHFLATEKTHGSAKI